MRFSAFIISSLLFSGMYVSAQSGFSTQAYPASNDTKLRVADFNHDGRPDLVGFNAPGHIYLNDGNGGFKAPVALPYDASFGAVDLAQIADLNGDGFPDIVECTHTVNAGKPDSHTVLVFLNDGSANFHIQETAGTTGCNAMTLGDVNADGHLDLVVAAYVPAASGTQALNYIQVLYGDGSGNLTPVSAVQKVNLDYSDGTNPAYTNCAINDLIGGNLYLDSQFSLFLNTKCDSLSSSPTTNRGETVLGHGDGSGNFAITIARTGANNLANGQLVDLNQDGKPDAVFTAAATASTSNLIDALNLGGGTFSFSQIGPVENHYSGTAVADLNGDGIDDIAAAYQSAGTNGASGPPSLVILSGTKTSNTFSTSQSFATSSSATAVASDVVSADFNGDGKADLATLTYQNTATPSGTINVYLNQAGGTATCSAPSTTNTNIICTPAKGVTLASPVTVNAASNVPNLTLNRLYLDNTSVYQTTAASVSTAISAVAGAHTLVLVSYNNAGQAFSSSTSFTVGAGTPSGCLPEGTNIGVSICSPTVGATVTSPLTINAGARGGSANITALRAYIDNVAVATVNNPTTSTFFQFSQSVTVAAGTHNLVVIAYESTGGTLSASSRFTVGGSASCSPSTAGAAICSPSQNATVSTPFTLTAGATTTSGVLTAIRVYSDNVAQVLVNNPQQTRSFSISPSLSLAKGKHNIVVVGYQSTGGTVSASESLTVQ